MTHPTSETLNLRGKYRGYRPGQLGRVRKIEHLWEFTSWPFEEGGKVFIYARPVADATANQRFECRKEIALVTWNNLRQQAYKRGFEDGWKYTASAARAYAIERAQEKQNAR